MRLTIVKTHLPSGKKWRVHVEVDSEAQMLRHVNQWNRSGKGQWLYFLDPPPMPQVTFKHLDEVPMEATA